MFLYSPYSRWVVARFISAAIVAFWFSSPASSEASESSAARQNALALQEALSRSLEHHPDLLQYPPRARAAEARALQAQLRPNPKVAFEVENVAGSGQFEGIDSAESSLVLSQMMELGGKRERRHQVAQLAGELVDREYELARLDVLTDTAMRYLETVQAQELATLAELEYELAKRARVSAKKRVDAGGASAAELSRADIALTRARLGLASAKRATAIARGQLAANWARARADFERVQGNLFQLPTIPSYSTLSTRLEQAPELSRLMTMERLKRAEIQLAQAQGRQNLEVGGGIKRFEDSGDYAMVFSVSMPIGVSDRNQGEVRARRAEHEQLAIETQAVELAFKVGLQQLYLQAEQAREAALALKREALPQAEEALEHIETGYAIGRYSYLELMDMRRERVAIEREAIKAAAGFFKALMALEQLTGEPLTQTAVMQSQRASNHAVQPSAEGNNP